MAKEIQFQSSPVDTSGTYYAIIRSSQGQPWRVDTQVFETWTDGNFAHYAITMTEEGTSGYYTADFPGVTADDYAVVVYKQAGGSPSLAADTVVADGIVVWPGVAVITATATPDDWSTLAYVKNHLQVTASTWDTFIQQYITGASRAARSYINGRQLLATDYTEVRNGEGTDYLRVYNYPIISLTQVITDYGLTTEQTVPNTEFVFEPNTGILKFKQNSTYYRPFAAGFQTVRVDYRGGFSTVPYDVQTAVAIIVGKLLWSQNRANVGVESLKVKDVTKTYFNPWAINLADPLFAEAASILDRYRNRAY